MTQNTQQRPWKARPDLMDRLTIVQNSNTHSDIMTFAGFMDTEADLEAYVLQKEATLAERRSRQ